MQLVLLKAALLLGVDFRFNTTVLGVTRAGDAWHGVLRSNSAEDDDSDSASPRSSESLAAAGAAAADSSDAVAFKYGAQSDAALERQSKVDFVEAAESQDGAVLAADALPPGAALVPLDALLIAEGERSHMLRNLGFDRKVTRFGPALGLVINLVLPPAARCHELPGEFRHFVSGNDVSNDVLARLRAGGVLVEGMEYLRSTTSHFFVCTVLKQTLLDKRYASRARSLC